MIEIEKPKFFVKYTTEVEKYADIIVQICKDYGNEIGTALSEKGLCHEDIVSGEAEKVMLLGAIRYMLDCYMGDGE